MTQARADVQARPEAVAGEDTGSGRRRKAVIAVGSALATLVVAAVGANVLARDKAPSRTTVPTTAAPLAASVPPEALPNELKVSDLRASVVLSWVSRSAYTVVVQRWEPGAEPKAEARLKPVGIGTAGTLTVRNLDVDTPYCFRVGIVVVEAGGSSLKFTPDQPGGHPGATSWVCRESVPVPEGEGPPP